MNSSTRKRLASIDLWIWLCVVLNAGGWLLSAFGALNRTGYIAVAILTVIGAAVWWKANRPVFHTGIRCRRFRRIFPLAFAILAAMAILGGILHGPANYDALAYRTPRVLHWLAEGKWHWIHTDFQRLNTRSNGIEWLTAPLLLFTGTDRLFFLINACSFLLLPGICFRLLANLGVRKRVAWHWMWILPTGYCYILQAGSIANDLFGATLAFAAFDYALRARRERSATLACLAVLAAALMTSGKAFNILLLLPWGLAMFPNATIMLRRPLLGFGTGVLALTISIVPTSILNHVNCGDWKGLNAEPVNLSTASPAFHIGINAILIPLHHLNPPVNPLAGTWNKWTEKTLPQSWKETIAQSFEPSVITFKLGEMQMEETAGLGFGIALLLLAVLIGKHNLRTPPLRSLFGKLLRPENLIPAGAAFSALYFLAQSGLGCPSRYLASFYLLLLAPVLRLPRAATLAKRRWWRSLALLSFAMAALLLILTPPRPLWPATTILKAMKADQSDSPLLKRVWTVYSVYGIRSDGFQPVKAILPENLDTIGFVTFDDPETSLWKPFGARRVRHVTRADTPQSLQRIGVEFVLVSGYIIDLQHKSTIDEWLLRYNAEIVTTMDLTLRATRGSTPWHLVKLRPASPSSQN